MPKAHPTHAPPSVLNFPASHEVHCIVPSGVLPAAQVLQDEAPGVRDTLPDAHGMQSPDALDPVL